MIMSADHSACEFSWGSEPDLLHFLDDIHRPLLHYADREPSTSSIPSDWLFGRGRMRRKHGYNYAFRVSLKISPLLTLPLGPIYLEVVSQWGLLSLTS